MALNRGDGVTGEKIIDLQGYRERRGVLFLVCVKGENQVFTHHHCHKVFIELSLQRNSEI